MAGTRRPMNQCRRCGYTWHPRGHNLSRSCGNCGSRDVEIHPWVRAEAAAGAIMMLGMALFAVWAVCAGGIGGPGEDRDRASSPRRPATTVTVAKDCDLWGF